MSKSIKLARKPSQLQKKKKARPQFSNIVNDANYDKLKELEKKYNLSNTYQRKKSQISRNNVVERIRNASKKKFFSYFLYGYFEVKELEGELPGDIPSTFLTQTSKMKTFSD